MRTFDSVSLRAGWQRHHIIPNAVYLDDVHKDFFEELTNERYEQQDFEFNGVALPGFQADAGASGFSRHIGSHSRYTKFVTRMIEEISDDTKRRISEQDQGEEDAYDQAARDLRGLQAFLIDKLTTSLQFDHFVGVEYGTPHFAMNRKGFLNDLSDEELDGLLEQMYDAISYQDVKASIAFAQGSRGDFYNYTDRQGGIFDSEYQIDGQYVDAVVRTNLRTRELEDPYVRSALALNLYENLQPGRFMQATSVVQADTVYLASAVDYAQTPLALWDRYLPGIDQVEGSTGLFGQVGKDTVPGVGLADIGVLSSDDGTAFVLTPLGGLKFDHIRKVVAGLTDEAPALSILGIIDTALEAVPQAAVRAVAWVFDGVADVFTQRLPRLTVATGDVLADGSARTDLMLGAERSKLYGGDASDWMLHLGSGELHGGSGHDFLVSFGSAYNGIDDRMDLYGDGGDDLIAFIGGAGGFAFGGDGDDLMWGGGQESHLWGGEGADSFFVGANTNIHDATFEDEVYLGPLRLYGGVQQWWMESNIAYWAPFSTILTQFPVIGSEVLYTASFFMDVMTMSFASYAMDEDGRLQIDIGWGLGAKAAIDDYTVDLDSGVGTGGITVFSARQGAGKGPTLRNIKKFVNLALNAGFGVGYGRILDPLVLDLDGDGLELTTEANSGVYFDYLHDGFGQRTGWVRPDDGLLVRDRNGDGRINDIGELFGNETIGGFTALGALDTDRDGRITAADTDFAALKVWRDLDGDGATDDGELQGLTDLGIAAISLAATATPEGTTVAGNAIARQSGYTLTDGTTRAIADVHFEISPVDTRYLGDASVSDAASALPQLAGFGTIRDLRVAMTQDDALRARVAAFAANATHDLAQLKAVAEAIVYQWAGIGTVASTAIGGNGFDARKLAFLEAYAGVAIMPRDASGNVLTTNLPEVEQLWADTLARLTLRLVVQGPMATAFAGVRYDANSDQLVAASSTSIADILRRVIAALPSTDHAAASVAWAGWAPLLAALTSSTTRSDSNEVRDDYLFQQLVRAADGVVQPLSLAELARPLSIENLRIGTGAADTLVRSATGRTAILYGAGGADSLTGGTGQDVYVFGRSVGHATITDVEAMAGGDRIRFAFLDPDDVAIVRDGQDLLVTVEATGETIRVVGQFAPVVPLSSDAFISSNRGIEDIQFADGTIFDKPQIMRAIGTGGDGADTIVGTMHSDVLLGGKGDDVLEGGDDADLYAVDAGDGHDIIHDAQTTPLLRAADLLIFGDDIAPEDIAVARAGADGSDLVISIGGGGQSVTIRDQFAYGVLGFNGKFALNTRVDLFSFREHGDTWGSKDIQQRLIAQGSTDADDVVLGFGDDDIFDGGAGDDVLVGMDGQDTYRWGRGDGNDVIDERARFIDVNVGLSGLSLGAPADTIVFTDANRDDLIFARPGDATTLVVTDKVSGETLSVLGQFAGFQTGTLGAQWFDRVEWFRFADGGRLSWQDVARITTTGSDAAETLRGDVTADRIAGGKGDDRLSGFGGGDTYVFAVGDGHDTIDDRDDSFLNDGFVQVGGAIDVLQFGAGIAPGDIAFDRHGVDVDLIVGTGGDRVTLSGQDAYVHSLVFGSLSAGRTEEIRFADGTTWTWRDLNARMIAAATSAGDDVTVGTSTDDVFLSSAGDDVLDGGDGNDVYRFDRGSGRDRALEHVDNVAAGDDDELRLGAGIAPSDIVVSRSGNDLTLAIRGTQDRFTIAGQFAMSAWFSWSDIERFTFADGTSWSKADVSRMLLAATAGDDILLGTGDNDYLDGGAGDDELRGDDGSDTYVFSRGYGRDSIHERVENTNVGEDDQLLFGAGIALADLRFTRDGDDLRISIAGTGDVLTVIGQFARAAPYAWNDIERFVLADGTILSKEAVTNRVLAGTASDDHIVGFGSDDLLDGEGGDDVLEGRDGSDTYRFGVGDGHDRIVESLEDGRSSEDDTLAMKPGVATADVMISRDGQDAVFTLSSGDSIRVVGQFDEGYNEFLTARDVERVRFSDGTEWNKAEIDRRSIRATDGDDVMLGSWYAQRYDGGAGNDRIAAGGDDDILIGGTGDDRLEGDGGNDIYHYARGDGHDVIRDHNWGNDQSDRLVFGPGILAADIVASRVAGTDSLKLSFVGAVGSIMLQDQYWNDTGVELFEFADGTILTQDDLFARAVATRAYAGTSGDDRMPLPTDFSLVDGSAGNDTLIVSGNGGGRILYRPGSGHDVLDNPGDGYHRDDILVLEGLAPTDVALARHGDAVRLTIRATGETFEARWQFYGGGNDYGLGAVHFADGTRWDRAAIRAAAVITGTAGDDRISLTANYGIVDPGAGDDYIIVDGNGGGDIRFRAGSGHDRLDNPGDGYVRSDRLVLEDLLPDDVTLRRDGDRLHVTLRATGDSFEARWQFYGGGNAYGLGSIRFADGTEWDRAEIGQVLAGRSMAAAPTEGSDRHSAIALDVADVAQSRGYGRDRRRLLGFASELPTTRFGRTLAAAAQMAEASAAFAPASGVDGYGSDYADYSTGDFRSLYASRSTTGYGGIAMAR